jgi:osomolarity two-component system response regulator SKN7
LSKHLLTSTDSASVTTDEPSETMSSLQGPAQQTLVLPQEVQQQDSNGEPMPEPHSKKPRLI